MTKFVSTILLTILLLNACSPKQFQSTSQFVNTSTVTPTLTQKITRTPQPSKTPKPLIPTMTSTTQPPIEATIEAFGTICEPPTSIDSDGEFSPDGNWIAVECEGIDEKVSSYLRVVNVADNKDWRINYVYYSKYEYLDRRSQFYPFHWSRDGKYLFVTSPTLGSGCCWIGWDVILVRLNLDNGEQTEIANYEGLIPGGLSFSISPSDRYALSTPSGDLKILDLTTWEEKTIAIKVVNGSIGYPLMSPNETKVILMVREYPEELQGDLTFGSVVIIDIESGSQRKLLSGMEYENTPMPVNWKDDDHVLLYGDDKYWLLNINTSELTETDKP